MLVRVTCAFVESNKPKLRIGHTESRRLIAES